MHSLSRFLLNVQSQERLYVHSDVSSSIIVSTRWWLRRWMPWNLQRKKSQWLLESNMTLVDEWDVYTPLIRSLWHQTSGSRGGKLRKVGHIERETLFATSIAPSLTAWVFARGAFCNPQITGDTDSSEESSSPWSSCDHRMQREQQWYRGKGASKARSLPLIVIRTETTWRGDCQWETSE